MTPVEWTAIIVALIGAGLLKYAVDGYKGWKNGRLSRTPEAIRATQIATVDQSLTVVARARDELEDDNRRLRTDNDRLRRQQAESDARHDAERARWDLREAAMRAEINSLERKLRALLSEVEKLKDKHSLTEVEERRSRHSQFPGPSTS